MMRSYDPDRDPMRLDPCKPGLLGLLRGEGELSLRIVAWAGTVVLGTLFLAEALSLIFD